MFSQYTSKAQYVFQYFVLILGEVASSFPAGPVTCTAPIDHRYETPLLFVSETKNQAIVYGCFRPTNTM